MPRNITSAAANVINLSMGGLAFVGDVTIARLWKRAATDSGTRISLHVGTDTGATRYLMSQNNNQLQITVGANTVAETTTGTAAAGPWVLQAVQKATGTTTPRFHKYDYSTGTWTHVNGASTLVDGSTPTGNAYLLNRATASTAAACSGDHAICGVWNAVLTDAQIEALAFSAGAWKKVAPNGLWRFTQYTTSQTVADLSGGGANETSITGTTVASLIPPYIDNDLAFKQNTVAMQRASRW